jgi:hypothetical protein
MIEDREFTLRAKKKRDARPNDERFGMLDLDPIATDELDRKRPKRRSVDQCSLKAACDHNSASLRNSHRAFIVTVDREPFRAPAQLL